MTDEGFGYDPQRGELWFAGEAAEAVLLELETRRRELEGEVAALRAKAAQAESDAAAAAERAVAAEAAYAEVAHLRTERAAKLAASSRASAGSSTRRDESPLARTSVPPPRSWSAHDSAAKGRSGCCRSTQPSATRSSGRHAS